jgi:hypothetical protein
MKHLLAILGFIACVAAPTPNYALSDVTFSARLKQPFYNVTLAASPEAGGSVAGGGAYHRKTTVTVLATPNAGYSFVNWTRGSAILTTSKSYTFQVTANVILTAHFQAVPPPITQYNVTVVASPLNGGSVIGGGVFNAGASDTITATPASGYNFVNWTEAGEVVSTAPSYTFAVNANHAFVANFAQPPISYTVSVSANPSNGGMVTGGGTFPSGSSDSVVAVPNDGFSFTIWSENGGTVSTSANYTFDVTAKRTLVANFAAIPPPPPPSGEVIPPERNFPWNPGMTSKGGIPNRTTVCATVPVGGNIQAALDSCPAGQVVQLSAGTYAVNNYLLIHSGITLRGAGAGQTILTKTNGARPRTSTVVPGTNGILTPVDPGSYSYDAQPIVVIGPSRWPGPDVSGSQNLTADFVQGSRSVTVGNASGFAADQFVLLDELSGATWQPVPVGFPCGACTVQQSDRVSWNIHNPTQPGDDPQEAKGWFSRVDRPTNEIKEIASISGNTITFTSPISIGYRVSHQAQLTRYSLNGSQSTGDSRHVTNAGIENLTLKGGADGELRFETAAYSWAKNVEIAQWIGEGIAVNNSFRVEVRDSYIHTGSWPEPGGGGYAMSFAAGSSEALIENNIMTDVNKVMVFRSSGTGSVVGYNYTDDGWIFGSENWVEVGINASHMAGPHHVLFEGNYSFNADSDYTHGNAIYLTFFRNSLSGQRRSFSDGNARAAGLAYGSWWDSFVGNVLGRAGQMSSWLYTAPAMTCDADGDNCTGLSAAWSDHNIWQFGYDPERWSMHPDPKVLITVIRDGNFDFLTNSQRWHNTPVGFVLPNSLYLTAKPAFFGNNPWPWVDPSNGTLATLPAKARYDAGQPF